jgi:hypothetical protein
VSPFLPEANCLNSIAFGLISVNGAVLEPYIFVLSKQNTMEYRNLGNTNEKLSAIGLGCMGMSFAYGPVDNEESIATLNLALDLGINFWDTADMYAAGKNEELISKVLKPVAETPIFISMDRQPISKLQWKPV